MPTTITKPQSVVAIVNAAVQAAHVDALRSAEHSSTAAMVTRYRQISGLELAEDLTQSHFPHLQNGDAGLPEWWKAMECARVTASTLDHIVAAGISQAITAVYRTLEDISRRTDPGYQIGGPGAL